MRLSQLFSVYRKQVALVSCIASLCVGGALLSCAQTPSVAPVNLVPITVPVPAAPVYRAYPDWLPHAIVHTVYIPAALAARLSIAVLPDGQLQTPQDFALALSQKTPSQAPVAVLNGGYFDPHNTRTTSYIMLNGQMVADPTDNPKLMQNPALKALLPAIFNRSELRRMQCGTAHPVYFNITPHSQSACTLTTETGSQTCATLDSLGAGPQLLPENTAEREAFIQIENGQRTRDPLGTEHPNARSAVGLSDQGDIWLVMVEQQALSSGASLPQLAGLLKRLGASRAMALDGGSSSALWLGPPLVSRQLTVWGKQGQQGKPVHRPVKSFLVVTEK